jgi:GAF domain-containing protein
LILALLDAARTLAEAVARETEAGAVWREADAVLGEVIGHQLFTVLIHDAASGTVTRRYSSRPDEYPVQGSKHMGPTPWGDLLLTQGKPFIGNDADAIRWAFPDHEQILAMGLGSAINLPVRLSGRTLGTLNLLHEAGHYREEHLETGAVLAAIVAPLMVAL